MAIYFLLSFGIFAILKPNSTFSKTISHGNRATWKITIPTQGAPKNRIFLTQITLNRSALGLEFPKRGRLFKLL